MADKKIKIHLAASSDLAALRSANTELAKITLSVGRTNAATRQAALASAREWATLGGSADRAGSRVVLTAFQFTRPRGARRVGVERAPPPRCFNSRAREGRDPLRKAIGLTLARFQFTRPRGARRCGSVQPVRW